MLFYRLYRQLSWLSRIKILHFVQFLLEELDLVMLGGLSVLAVILWLVVCDVVCDVHRNTVTRELRVVT